MARTLDLVGVNLPDQPFSKGAISHLRAIGIVWKEKLSSFSSFVLEICAAFNGQGDKLNFGKRLIKQLLCVLTMVGNHATSSNCAQKLFGGYIKSNRTLRLQDTHARFSTTNILIISFGGNIWNDAIKLWMWLNLIFEAQNYRLKDGFSVTNISHCFVEFLKSKDKSRSCLLHKCVFSKELSKRLNI